MGQYVGTLYVDDIELVEWNENRQREVGRNLNTVNTNLDDAEQTANSIAVRTDANSSLEDVGCSDLGEGYDSLATYVEKTYDEKRTIAIAEMQKYVGGVIDAAKDDSGKLYIEESGLDTDLTKCAQFVNYISAVESQGGKVDGVAVSIDANTTTTSVDNIAQMFQSLAATGNTHRQHSEGIQRQCS